MKQNERGVAKIADLNPATYNPRKMSKEARHGLAASLKRFGLVQDVVVNRRNNVIVGGHQRIAALKVAGETEVPVIWVDLSEEEEKALNVTLNNPAIAGEFDDGLQALLAQIKADESLGLVFEDLRLDHLIEDNGGAGKGRTDPNAIPPTPPTAITKPGDLIILGRHRLVCGSATRPEDFRKLMGGEKAQLVWTDPPYGVAYVGKTKDAMTIANDALDAPALRAFLAETLGNAFAHTAPGAAWYVAAPSGDIFLEFGHVLGREGLGVWRHTLVWLKDRFVMGRCDYHYKHESIFYGWTSGGAHYFVDDRTLDTVIEVPRPSANPDHPTMKPVELVAKCIQNSSKPNWLVLDCFGGSGSTLIACEQEGRRAALLELSPVYCDVIVRRWEEFSGQKAVREEA